MRECLFTKPGKGCGGWWVFTAGAGITAPLRRFGSGCRKDGPSSVLIFPGAVFLNNHPNGIYGRWPAMWRRRWMRNLILVGSCSGAILAAFVARELREMGRPEVVARLVLIDPFAYCPWYFRFFLLPLLGFPLYAATFANPAGRWLTNLFLREKRAGETDLTASFTHVNHRVTWRYLRMLDECGYPEQFRGMPLAVDILHGQKTFSAVRRSVGIWKEALPQARITELPGVGHLPIAEGTAEVARIVFRKESPGGAGAKK
ncbi:MAG: alpha/beta hydrolase [Verrucomicrobia bacterium]|nr:alpha/beta hydrolase [Verrucomicrobiota bacterium]